MSNFLKKLVLFTEVCMYPSICHIIYFCMDSGSLILLVDILLQDDMYVCMYLSFTEVFFSVICTFIIQYCTSFKMTCSLSCCYDYSVDRTVRHYLHSLFKISTGAGRSLVHVFKVVPLSIKGLTLSVCDTILVSP